MLVYYYVQVFNKESSRHREFAMSCYDAFSTYLPRRKTYFLEYLDDGRGPISEMLAPRFLRPHPMPSHDPMVVYNDPSINGSTHKLSLLLLLLLVLVL